MSRSTIIKYTTSSEATIECRRRAHKAKQLYGTKRLQEFGVDTEQRPSPIELRPTHEQTTFEDKDDCLRGCTDPVQKRNIEGLGSQTCQ